MTRQVKSCPHLIKACGVQQGVIQIQDQQQLLITEHPFQALLPAAVFKCDEIHHFPNRYDTRLKCPKSEAHLTRSASEALSFSPE
jgi:hypothetical protein